MIKKYKQFITESILDKLQGPTDEEMMELLSEYKEVPHYYIIESVRMSFFPGVKYGVEVLNGNINYHNHILQIAIETENDEIFYYLLKHGAKVNGSDNHALYQAILYNRLDLVKVLIECGADKNQIFYVYTNGDEDNFNPYMLASINEYDDIVNYLISIGADKKIDKNKISYENGRYYYRPLKKYGT